MSEYEPSPQGIMDCLTDAILAVAGNPLLTDSQQLAAVVQFIEIAGAGLTLANVRQLIDAGLRECNAQLGAGTVAPG